MVGVVVEEVEVVMAVVVEEAEVVDMVTVVVVVAATEEKGAATVTGMVDMVVAEEAMKMVTRDMVVKVVDTVVVANTDINLACR